MTPIGILIVHWGSRELLLSALEMSVPRYGTMVNTAIPGTLFTVSR